MQLGYRPAPAAAGSRQAKSVAGKKEAEAAPEESSAEPQLLNVALLLRIFRAVCLAKVRPGRRQNARVIMQHHAVHMGEVHYFFGNTDWQRRRLP